MDSISCVASGESALSVLFRRFDMFSATRLFGAVRGTHALWHLLNAATIYILLAVAINAVGRQKER